MTVRLEHLVIAPDQSCYLVAPQDGGDALNGNYRYDLLAMVRHIMRDEPCSIIPVIRAATVHPTNQYGHDLQVEVTYSKRGYRAIYAGTRTAEGLTNVQCYMD